MNVGFSTALVLSIGVVTAIAATGCLTLSTVDQTTGGGGAGGGASSSASGSSPVGSSSSTGSSGGECNSSQDCPVPMPCRTRSCVNGTCVSGFDQAGAGCFGDRVCNDSGDCVECLNNDDCSGSSASCINEKCISCSDGIKNGNEVGVDCGGSKCSACVMTCTEPSVCPSNNCVDGVCCDTPCTDACKSCNLTGKVGTCSSLPTGTTDPGICEATMACSGGFIAKCLLANGQKCLQDNQCASDNCASGTDICAP